MIDLAFCAGVILGGAMFASIFGYAIFEIAAALAHARRRHGDGY